jgi:hypothetical protein
MPKYRQVAIALALTVAVVGGPLVFAQGGGGGGGSAGGGAAGAASHSGAAGSTGTPSAGSMGAGPSGVNGVPAGPANAGGTNNAVNDPSGAGNAPSTPQNQGTVGLAKPQGGSDGSPRDTDPNIAAPGTNSAGTSLSSGSPSTNSALRQNGTTMPDSGGPTATREQNSDAQINAENRKLDRTVTSICKGC